MKNVIGFQELVTVDDAQDAPVDDGVHLAGPKDCAIIMYTSGSTGTPKGVILTHENLLCSMSALVNIAKFRQRDRYIGYLPLAHVLELLAESSCLLYGIKIGYRYDICLSKQNGLC